MNKYLNCLTVNLKCISIIFLFIGSASAQDTIRFPFGSYGLSGNPSISGDGQFIVSQYSESVLVPDCEISLINTNSLERTRIPIDVCGSSPSLNNSGSFLVFHDGATLSNQVISYNSQSKTKNIISQSALSQPGNGNSFGAGISGDGRFIAFYSTANNLVSGNFNDNCNVYLKDTVNGNIKVITHSYDGGKANGLGCYNAKGKVALSFDGRYIVYRSSSTNLVSDDTNGADDIFKYDQQTGKTELVSRSASGTIGNAVSAYPSISNDGRFIAFTSYATNLVTESLNSQITHIFIKDMENAEVILISGKDQSGAEIFDASHNPVISGNGQFVVINGLIKNKYSDIHNVFKIDRISKEYTLISGNGGNNHSYTPVVSNDGSKIVFASDASNLVSDDNNYATDTFLYRKDACPSDPDKTSPGICGCSVPDQDKNNNGILDCQDPRYLTPNMPIVKKAKKSVTIQMQSYQNANKYNVLIKRANKKFLSKSVKSNKLTVKKLKKGSYTVEYSLSASGIKSKNSKKTKFKW